MWEVERGQETIVGRDEVRNDLNGGKPNKERTRARASTPEPCVSPAQAPCTWRSPSCTRPTAGPPRRGQDRNQQPTLSRGASVKSRSAWQVAKGVSEVFVVYPRLYVRRGRRACAHCPREKNKVSKIRRHVYYPHNVPKCKRPAPPATCTPFAEAAQKHLGVSHRRR